MTMTAPPQVAPKAAASTPDPEKRNTVSVRPDSLLDNVLTELERKRDAKDRPGWGVTRNEAMRRLAALGVFFIHPAFADVVEAVSEQARVSFTRAAQVVREWCNAARQQHADEHPVAVDFAALAKWQAALKRGCFAVLVIRRKDGLAEYSVVVTDEAAD